MKFLEVIISSVICLALYWKTDDISIVGNVNPKNIRIGEDVILSCQVINCRSPNPTVHLYKWEGSANKTLYIHNNKTQPSIQGHYSGERDENRTQKGQYTNGYLEVTFIKVKAADAGQYVCALTCGHVYKEDTMEMIPRDTINASAGEEVILPCPLIEEHELFYLKMHWRRICQGKHQTIYSYLFQNTSSVAYSEDTLGLGYTSSNGPTSRVWFGEKYRQKAEVFKGNELRNENGYLKLKNIQQEDAGTYLYSAKSNLLHKDVIFQLSVKDDISIVGNVNPKNIHIGEDVILSCQVINCRSPDLTVHLYKWESSANKTFYIHNNKTQPSIQGHYSGERDENRTQKGQYTNGYLEVTLKVKAADVGQYVCALTCGHVYKEDTMEMIPRGIQDQDTDISMFHSFGLPLLCFFSLLSFLLGLCVAKVIGQWQINNKLRNLQTEMDNLIEERRQWQIDNEKCQKLQCEVKWRRACSNADPITLDAESAHLNLSIDVNRKCFTYEPQPVSASANPQRFDGIVAVLGSKGFSSGKHYWTVDVGSSSEWDLGVARGSIPRKGQFSIFPKEGFWILGRSGKDYWAKTDPWTRLVVQKKPSKIGVFLSFQPNEVTFFNVDDMSVLFVFRDCSFTEGIFPFFKNTHKGSTMEICSIREENA